MAALVPPPPPADPTQRPYGTKLKAGLGESTVIAELDFETYSEAGFVWDENQGKWNAPFGAKSKGLPLVGAKVYSEHPTAEVLCAAYDLKDGKGRRLWIPGMPNPTDLFQHLENGGLLEAFNMPFEEKIWMDVCVPKYGWPPLPFEQLRCAKAKARAFCYPGSLDKAAQASQAPIQKNKDGMRLIRKFSIPRKPTKRNPRKRIKPLEDLDDAKKLYQYCLTDIHSEASVSALCPDLNEQELAYWQMDQECNRAGLRLDKDAVLKAIDLLEGRYAEAIEKVKQITDGKIESFNQNQKIVQFLQERGVNTKSIAEDVVTEMLDNWPLPDDCRELLETRRSVASAAVKKLYTMRVQMTDDGRVYDAHEYHGARTGRDAGRGIQVQNMPNSGIDYKRCGECSGIFSLDKNYCPHCRADASFSETHEWDDDAADMAIGYLKAGTLEYVFSDPIAAISGCIRGLIIADEGCDFITSDYSSIEAVVAAILAGEQWRIDVFERKGDIYLESASRITGTSVDEYYEYKRQNGSHHPHRKLGKVAELASGYGGWVGSWLAFGADSFLSTEEEIKEKVQAWRSASPAIVDAWGGQVRGKPWDGTPELYGLEGLFIKAVLNPGEKQYWREGIYYLCEGKNVYCVLPSGRYITYHNVSLGPHHRWENQLKIMFWGYNTNPGMGPIGWVQLDTYGGRLFENVVQAVARDIMSHAAVNLNNKGYKVRLRVHDELATMVKEGWGSVFEMEAIMCILPDWAADWPIRASGGWRGKRFRK